MDLKVDVSFAFWDNVDPNVVELVNSHLIAMKEQGELQEILEAFQLTSQCEESETGDVLTLFSLGGAFIIPGVTIAFLVTLFLISKVCLPSGPTLVLNMYKNADGL